MSSWGLRLAKGQWGATEVEEGKALLRRLNQLKRRTLEKPFPTTNLPKTRFPVPPKSELTCNEENVKRWIGLMV